jgi:hypothetical protein
MASLMVEVRADHPFGASPLLIVEEATAAPIGGAARPA